MKKHLGKRRLHLSIVLEADFKFFSIMVVDSVVVVVVIMPSSGAQKYHIC